MSDAGLELGPELGPQFAPQVGVVVIGRNEGERLVRCLESVAGDGRRVVYVDSGSTDGSVETAAGLGAEVVELDLSVPFTAARARNAGLAALDEATGYVQFVDGDCEMNEDWIETALGVLESDEGLAAVAGRLRERMPERSVYNRLCEIEWDAPAGEADAVGGIAMMRVSAVRDAGGFDPMLVAGEEPELCFRMRQAGHRIRRLKNDMGWHDAAMTRFGQWWKRAVRSGHAAAEGAWMHGRSEERYNVRRVLRPVFWAGALPVGALVLAWWTYGLSLVALAVLYAAQGVRLWRRESSRLGSRDARVLAVFTLLGQFAALVGVVRFGVGRLLGRGPRLIEYKTSVDAGASG